MDLVFDRTQVGRTEFCDRLSVFEVRPRVGTRYYFITVNGAVRSLDK
jgi:hypothetical protein